MKNEAPFILEWVAHYRVLGFSHIFVATNDCEDTTTHILDRLQQKKLVVHHRTVHWPRSTPHKSALRQLSKYRKVRRSDWVLVCDVDEFLNIHVGDGSVQALVAAQDPKVDIIHIPWRIFGSAGITEFQDRWVTRQFRQGEPPPDEDPASAAQSKALFRNPRRFDRIGVHVPIRRQSDEAPLIEVYPDGQPAALREARNYNAAQLNHYALRSAESYEVKKARGRAHHVNHTLGDEYWQRYDRNQQEDLTISRYERRVHRFLKRLMRDPELARLHQMGVEWHKAKALGQNPPPIPDPNAPTASAKVENLSETDADEVPEEAPMRGLAVEVDLSEAVPSPAAD